MNTTEEDPYLWSVDRSWTQYRGNSDGELPPSERRKLHLATEDTVAKCSSRVLLNSMPGDRPAGRLSHFEADDPDVICRRCLPRRIS